MEIKRLKEVANLNMGQSPASESYNSEGKGIPFFQGKADFGRVNPVVRMYCSSPNKIAIENDILMSVRAPVGDVNLSNLTCCIGRGLAAITPKYEIMNYKYLYYALINMKDRISSLGTGSTFKAINKGILENIEVPVPSLEEQQLVTEALNKVQELIDKRQVQIEACDELVKSLFYHMFGDDRVNNKGWDLKSWCEVFSTTTGKLDANAMNENGKYPFFTCAKEVSWINEYSFDGEALLLAGNNATADYDVKYYNGKFNAYQRTYVLTLNNQLDCYKFFRISLENKLKDLKDNSIGSNTKYLTLKILNDISFIVPPSSIQNRFAEQVKKIEQQKQRLQQSLTELENNFNALMQRAFKGELF
ncbi:restriction endonuclease subunit S [Paenibacillus sp. y28]|uniref:restriction endonuclease subunit S n=1 Tax=Paenibacillus sp. y28 TaxID=3129110 RepID=UPI0030165760